MRARSRSRASKGALAVAVGIILVFGAGCGLVDAGEDCECPSCTTCPPPKLIERGTYAGHSEKNVALPTSTFPHASVEGSGFLLDVSADRATFQLTYRDKNGRRVTETWRRKP